MRLATALLALLLWLPLASQAQHLAPVPALDSPVVDTTGTLDATQKQALVQQAMERLMHGRTVLVGAHRLATVRGLDRIVVFEHGRVVEDGPHATLVGKEGGLYRRLYTLQSL